MPTIEEFCTVPMLHSCLLYTSHSINPAYDVMRKDHYGFIKSIGRVIGILDLDDFATESEIACFKQRN